MATNYSVGVRFTGNSSSLNAAAKDAAAAEREVGRAGQQAGDQASAAFGRTRAGVQSISVSLQRVRTEILSFIGAQALLQVGRGTARMADEYANIGSQMRQATDNAVSFAHAQDVAYGIAQRTASSLASTADLASKLTRSLRDMGEAGDTAFTHAAGLTETIQQAIALSHVSAESGKAAVIQLTQGLASGVLRGDELNSVLEQTPRLARAIADGMGVTVGQLRALGAQGLITGQQVITALRTQHDALADEYADLPLTIDRAWSQLVNAVERYVGQADQATGASNLLARGVSAVANHLDVLVAALETVGAVAAVNLGSKAVTAAADYARQLTVTVRTQVEAVVAERTAAAAALETAQAESVKATASLQAVQAARATATAQLATAQADMVAAQRHLDAANAAGVLSYAQRQQQVATDALTAAKLRQSAAITELANLGRMEAGVQVSLTAAATAQVAAQSRIASAVTMTGAAMTGLAKVGSSLLALLGGWPGVVLMAAAAVVYLATRQTEAEQTAAKLTDTSKQLADAHGRVTQSALDEANALLASTQAAIEKKKAELESARSALQFSLNADIAARVAAGAAADLDKLTRAYRDLTDAQQKAVVDKAIQENADKLAQMARDETQGFDALRTSLKEQNAELAKQIATFGKGRVAQLEYAKSVAIAAEQAKGDTNVTRARIAAITAGFAPLLKTAAIFDDMTAASKRHTGATKTDTDAQRQAADAARELARANQDIANGQATLDEQITELREKLSGLSDQQIEYNRGVRDAVEAYKEWIRAGIPMQQAQRALQDSYDKLNERLQVKNALDEKDVKNTPAKVKSYETQTSAAERYYQVIEQGAKTAADAIGNYFVHNVRGIVDLWRGLVDAAKQVVAQIISTWLQLRVLQPLLGGVFGGSGGGGWMGLAGSVAGMAGGNEAGASEAGGGASGVPGAKPNYAGFLQNGVGAYKAYQWASTGGLWGGAVNGAGGTAGLGANVGAYNLPGGQMGYVGMGTNGGYAVSPYAAGPAGGSFSVGAYSAPWASAAGGLLGAYYGSQQGGGGLSTVASTASYGALGAGIAGTAAGVAGGASLGTAAGSAFGAMAAGTSWIPVVGWIMAAMAAVDAISGGKLFGTSYQTTVAGTALNLGPDGASADQWTTEKKQGALFSGAKWRTTHSAPNQELTDAANQLYDSIEKSMVQGARQLGEQVPDMITAALVVQNNVSKGKVKSTDYMVHYMGQVWKEATAEAAAQRIGADALLSVVAKSAGDVANQIASQWQKSAETLQDGVQMLLAAQTDIVHGNALVALGTGATLRQVTSFVQSMQVSGEKLADTYNRLMQASQAYTQFVGQFAPVSNTFGASLEAIAKQMQANIDQANALAQAAGMQGAAESDLVNIHQRAAEQAATAIAQLSSAAQDLAAKLYNVTGTSLQAVSAQLDAMQSRTQTALQLAIGDKSPLSGKEKLDLALSGLRSGLTSADDVLSLGRSLYASSADYTGLYNMVQGIVGTGANGTSQSVQDAVKQYNDLAGQRAQLQAAADATQRFADAKTLAQYVSEISTTHGIGYSEAASGLGFNLGDLAKDLGVTNIAGYLDSLKLQDIPGSMLDASGSIVDAIQKLGRDLIATITGAPITNAPGVTTAGNTSTAEQTALLKEINQRLAAIEGNTGDTASTNKSMARDSSGAILRGIAGTARGVLQ